MIPLFEEPLKKDNILSLLHPKVLKDIGENIIIYQTIDSTNVEAKRLLKEEAIPSHGTVLFAEHQSAGRGRLGRSFYSPENSGIYMSMVYGGEDFFDNNNSSVAITVAAAVAVRRSLFSFGVDVKIKWVNDLFAGNKKICGILTEGIFSASSTNATAKVDTYIIGIGVNVFESKQGFPDELKTIAGTMNKNIDRNELAASIINNLFDVLSMESNAIIDEYREHSFVLHKTVTVVKPNESYTAKVLKITDEAHLLVELEDGSTEELMSGEISLALSTANRRDV